MAGDASAPVPGWYPDPQQSLTQRYWSGTAWTEQTRPFPPPVTPPVAAPVAIPESNGFAVAALVCGILGVVGMVLPSGSWMVDVAAIVLGVLGRRRAIEYPSIGGRGMATAGIVLGIAGLALAMVSAAFFFGIGYLD